ncbi:MAG TPA: BON domain-containing protein [Pirellulales bacterium]|nr:BON domain-containing protein [Pirellulales bacterium]
MQRMIRGLAIVAIAALWPAMAAAADQEASQRIAAALRSSGQFVDYSIGVKFDNGNAWLLGRVASEQQRQLAISMVQQMDGVTSVVDKLEIKSSRQAAAAKCDTGVRFAGSQACVCPPASRLAAVQTAATQPVAAQPVAVQPVAVQPVAAQPAAAQTAGATESSLTADSYNDPGDPLAKAQAVRFAPSKSRRFAPEPNYNLAAGQAATTRPPASRATASNAVALAAQQGRVRQVSQEVEFASEPQPSAAPGPISNSRSRPGSYRLAGPAPTNGQVIPAGFNSARTTGPNYGPAMGGGCVGGPCVGGNCAVPPYEQPRMPCYAWPSYAAYPNYAAVTYPRQYSPTAWPYIGPFYPYPQVPLGWRKVCLEWDDGWWWLDFYDNHRHH